MQEVQASQVNKMCNLKKYHRTSNTRIDSCMRPLIKFLQDHDFDTVACCCGHNKYPMTVIAKFRHKGQAVYKELLSDTVLPRIRRFYKRDKQGYYYIPEVSR